MLKTGPYRALLYALCLALLPISAQVSAQALAQQDSGQAAPVSAPSAPSAPSSPPAPKPEFGSFRMKPILEPHLNARKPSSDNASAPHTPTPNPAHTLGTLTLRPPMRSNLATQSQPAQPPTPQTPALQTPEQTPEHAAAQAAPSQSAAPLTVQSGPETALETAPATTPDHISAGITASGLPIPLAKPTQLTQNDAPQPTLLERIIATAQFPDTSASIGTQDNTQTALLAPIPIPPPPPLGTQELEPSPPSETDLSSQHDDEASDDDFEPIAEADVPPSTPVRLNRFDAERRMAGANSGYTLGSTERASLPASMRNIRIGRLQESQDVSPIIIPGLQKAAIPRAPDVPRSVDQTRPDEVILFFEENSNRLESGQMAIIHTDVIELLRRRPELKVDIIGYAEELPPEQAREDINSEQLSRARALMLRDYLIRNKIDERRIMVTGRANKTRIEPRDRADLFFTR